MARRGKALRGEEHLLHQRIDANVVKGLLSELHTLPEWVFATEVKNRTGYARDERFFDAFAMHCWPSEGYRRIAYEIKVSRADFMGEMKDPMKRDEAMKVSNEFYYVCPREIAAPDEVPENCGLYHVVSQKGGWVLKKIKGAQQRTIEGPLPIGFVASLCRNIADTSMAGMEVFRVGGHTMSAEQIVDAFQEGNKWHVGSPGKIKKALDEVRAAMHQKAVAEVEAELGKKYDQMVQGVKDATGHEGPMEYPYQVIHAIERVKGTERTPQSMLTAMRGAADLLERTARNLRTFIDGQTKEK